jgi:FkbM family methyltransferase
MKKIKLSHNNIEFISRVGTSDEKTFKEVIVNNVYERKQFKINKGERWVDLGGNVGAFALVALSKGAEVDIYEPDPYNCKMIEENLKLNNYDANIFNKAVVANDKKKMKMYVGNDMQVWRNSVYKNWGNQSFNVDCIHFSEVLNDTNLCCKMDIEGAEMDILENMKLFPKKMVAEWSLDIDTNLNRYRKIVDKLKVSYSNFVYSKYLYNLPDDKLPTNIFPKADNFYCYE